MTPPAQRRAFKKYRAKPEAKGKKRSRERAWYARNRQRLKLKRCQEQSA
jgi:hypothetical protein